MRKKRGVEYWEGKRDRILRQRRSDWWGGVVLKRGGRVMGKKYRRGGVRGRNGGVERYETEEWIGISGMSCRRRSRKGRGA